MALGDLTYRGSAVWKRLVGNITTTRKFLRQTGDGANSAAPAWDQVTDADLSTTDITTNNVTISKHGFTPKAPNSSTQFLRGDATWATPAGGTNALLDAANHTDTTASAVTKGDLIVGNTTPAWDDLPVGTNGQVLTADSAEAMGMKWNTPSGGTTHTLLDGSTHTDTTASGVTKGDLIVGNSTPAWDDLAVGTNGQVLTANSAATNGVEWATATGGATYVRKTADTSRNTTTTPTDDPHLTFPVVTSAVYEFELLLIHGAANSTADFKLLWSVPASTTMLWGAIAGADPNFEPGTAATVPSDLNIESTSVPMGSTTDTSARFGSIFRGLVVTAGTSGSVTLQWAQNTSNAGNSTLYTNSFIKYQQIP